MRRIAVLVEVSPESGHLLSTCIDYCEAALKLGHSLYIFMYGNGVLNIAKRGSVQQGELNLVGRWKDIANNGACRIAVCITAASRRGCIKENTKASSREKSESNWFNVSGLGEWTEEMLHSDAVIQFK